MLTAGPAAGQQVSTAIVPVVGNVFGATMVRWKTDLEIVNDTGRDLDVGLELPFAPGSPFILLTLGAGQGQRFTDLAGQAFGLDQVLSPLRVTTAGPRSVSVRATAYAVQPTGERHEPQALAVHLGSSYYPLRILDHLAFSEDFRTNIGLVNMGSTDAEFVLALERLPGRILAVSHLRLAPETMIHSSIESLFPLISEGTSFRLLVETGQPETFVYASVVEAATQGARYVPGRVGAR